MKKLLNKNKFDPQKSFFELGIVRWTVGITTLTAFLAALTIIICSNLNKDFSYNGFNHAITVFKFPLGILATLIPFIALLATNHRSEQTKEQIKQASNNNNFTNYFKHLSEFESYIEKHKTQKDIKFKSLRNLHKLIFPQSKKGNFRVSPELTHDISSTIRSTIQKIDLIEEIKKQIREIEESHSTTKDPLTKKETISLNKIQLLQTSISEKESKRSISDLGLLRPIPAGLEEAKENLKKEQRKLISIRSDIKKINEIIDEEAKPTKEQLDQAINDLQDIANHIIHRAKLKKIQTTNPTTKESEEQEFEIITRETKSEAVILEKLASAIQTLDISLQFDEEYETPPQIEQFINLFENVNEAMTGKYKHSIEKYKEQIKDT